ncbi:DUF2184 domain-containing protein [Shinella granuli]|uniref:DUF2184 domain-containing protein n=1 Tax=Shinella granuli TaxID=323621 RepID=A0A4R2CK37_SHIGR|nr:major capsid family protein [Shinella granuli]TCN41417.1 hypothetical protein EV665_1132 [Shinella granuli]
MNVNFQFDAQAAMGFVVSQTTHVEAAVNETVYPDIQYPALIPVDTSAHPFAQTVTYYSSDKFGAAKWINGNADDIPLAGTELTQHKTSVYAAGIGYGWGWEEINVAMMLGRNLQNDDAMAARRAYEEMVDRVALAGDAEKGFDGLLDNAAITPAAAVNGDWDGTGADPDSMLADVNEAILSQATGTLYTSVADTVLMSNGKINTLATRRLGDTTMTVLEFLRRNNTYTAMTGQPLTIRGVRGLETAGAGNTERLIAYRRDPQVLRLHIPMPHRFLPVYQDGPLRWVVPGVFRLGGLDIRRPAEVKYRDGI